MSLRRALPRRTVSADHVLSELDALVPSRLSIPSGSSHSIDDSNNHKAKNNTTTSSSAPSEYPSRKTKTAATSASSTPRHDHRTMRPHRPKKRRPRRTTASYFCTRKRLARNLGGLFVLSFGMAFLLVRWMRMPRYPQLLVDDASQLFQQYSPNAPECTPLTQVDQVGFTLVTQCSEDRLWMLEYHCQRWPGPISIAVLSAASAETLLQNNPSIFMACNSNHNNSSRLMLQTLAANADDELTEYPVNVLRNQALAVISTSHAVYVDIDFWESTDLNAVLESHREFLLSSDQTALIVPAFQLNRQCVEYKDCRENNIPVMPHTREDLIHLLLQRELDPFDPTNPGGHGSVRYKDWLTQTTEQLLPLECVLSNRFEPYLVWRHCRDAPPFQEAFSGYGKNKMTFMMQLRRRGYRFWQVNAFVVHYPHLDSAARRHWNGGPNGSQRSKPTDVKGFDWLSTKRGRVDHTFLEFRDWMERTLPDQSVIPFCSNAYDDDARLWVDPSRLAKRTTKQTN